jgi:exopolyphosphatase/guanosine-5'-triphosphate,3'-diphosphate pyrophosphatase
VRDLAIRIYEQLGGPERGADDPDRLLLDWAARLSEVGLSIAHAQYHKHSAYVLSNADMPGFSRVEQQRLARVVLAHRGKLEKVKEGGIEDGDWQLVFALRLASALLRRRTRGRLPAFRVRSGEERVSRELPRAWLARNALTAAALESEAKQWETVGRQFAVRRMS